jgi:transcriptional regulator with XRE-family HTH domain
MHEEIIQIASRIKALREISGVSPESFSASLGMSADEYSRIENGETDLPVGLLIRIAHQLQVDLTDLLTGESPKLHRFCVVRKGHGLRMERKQQYEYESLAYKFIHKRVEPFLVTARPETAGKEIEYNSHPGQEFNYVLEGAMMLYIEDNEIELHAGDAVYFDSSHRHAMRALQGKPVQFLAITV